MSVIVTGMEMPENCASCDFRVDAIGSVCCSRTGSKVGKAVSCYERMKDCSTKSVKGMIKRIKELSIPDYEYHGCGEDTLIVEFSDVERVIKEYCGMEVDDGENRIDG